MEDRINEHIFYDEFRSVITLGHGHTLTHAGPPMDLSPVQHLGPLQTGSSQSCGSSSFGHSTQTFT